MLGWDVPVLCKLPGRCLVLRGHVRMFLWRKAEVVFALYAVFHSITRLANRGGLGSCRSQLIYFACGFTVQAIVEQYFIVECCVYCFHYCT